MGGLCKERCEEGRRQRWVEKTSSWDGDKEEERDRQNNTESYCTWHWTIQNQIATIVKTIFNLHSVQSFVVLGPLRTHNTFYAVHIDTVYILILYIFLYIAVRSGRSSWKYVSLFSCWSFSSSRCSSEPQMLTLPCRSLSWFQPLCFHILSLSLPGMWTVLRLLCLVLWVWLGLLFDSCFALFWFFTLLTWSPTFAALLTSFSFLLCMSLWLCASRDTPSAKSRSPSDSVNVHMIPLLTHMSVLFIIQSIARQNGNGDSIHPCFTPVLMSNSSVKCWPYIIFVLNPSYNIFMMVTILQGIP